MSVPQEMSVQRLMEISAGFEADALPSLPVFTHNANEQPGKSDVPQNAPADTAVPKEASKILTGERVQQLPCVCCAN